MSSKEIAELLDARHDNVKVTVERLAARGVITLPALKEVLNTGAGPRYILVYQLDKRSSLIVVAQISPEFTARVVDRWQELEATKSPAKSLTCKGIHTEHGTRKRLNPSFSPHALPLRITLGYL